MCRQVVDTLSIMLHWLSYRINLYNVSPLIKRGIHNNPEEPFVGPAAPVPLSTNKCRQKHMLNLTYCICFC